MFKIVKNIKEQSRFSIENQRLAENIKILKEVMLGDFSNSQKFTGFGGLWKDMQDISPKRTKNFSYEEQVQSRYDPTVYFFTPTEIIYFAAIVEKLGFNPVRCLNLLWHRFIF